VIGLLGSEWLRFRSRRIVRWLMLVAVIGIAVAALIAGSVSRRPTDAQLARGQRQYDEAVARCIEQGRSGGQAPAGPIEEACRGEFSLSQFVDVQGLALDDLDEIVLTAAFIVLVIGLVIGASGVGASWQTGTITTILTWEPRRTRWFLSRELAIGVGATLVTALLLAILTATMAGVVALRGMTASSSPWLSDAALTIARVAAVAGGFALIGGAVAMIGRHTAAALGAVFVYMAVLESIVRGLKPAMGRFLLGDNIGTVVTGETAALSQGGHVFQLTPGRGVLVIAAYVVMLVGVALVVLRVRDVN
jgi:hypothetical protein